MLAGPDKEGEFAAIGSSSPQPSPPSAFAKPRADAEEGETYQERAAFLIGRARLRRAVTFPHEIESRLDRVAPYRDIRPEERPTSRAAGFPDPNGIQGRALAAQ
jgi:hypothetical protein